MASRALPSPTLGGGRCNQLQRPPDPLLIEFVQALARRQARIDHARLGSPTMEGDNEHQARGDLRQILD